MAQSKGKKQCGKCGESGHSMRTCAQMKAVSAARLKEVSNDPSKLSMDVSSYTCIPVYLYLYICISACLVPTVGQGNAHKCSYLLTPHFLGFWMMYIWNQILLRSGDPKKA